MSILALRVIERNRVCDVPFIHIICFTDCNCKVASVGFARNGLTKGIFPMTTSVNSKTYTQYSVSPNLVGYSGPAHTASIKDLLNLGRTAAKPTPTFSGVVRSEGKLTRTLTLTGALTTKGDAILEIKTSIPVGADATDIDTLLNDMGAYLASATYKTIVKNSLINY